MVGAPKKLHTPKPTHGAVRQTDGKKLSASRRAAQPGSNVTLRSGEGLLNIKGKRTTEINLAANTVEILRMQAALRIETNPTRLEKLRKSIEIKTRFCERLKSELGCDKQN
jgi:hypothetical protein